MIIKKKNKVFEEMTFENDDKLNRKFIADNFNKLLSNTEEPLVMALNSPWGSGKTQFIYMWKNLLNGEQKESIYINLWEEDYIDNPFYSLMGSIVNKNSIDEGLKQKLKKAGSEIIRGLVEKSSGINLKNIFEKDLTKELKKEKLNFKKSLKEISQKIKNKASFPLIIFIDEIDRCRPDYAIKFLEIVKHFFDVKNTIFILGIDMEQLQHSVKSIYGNDMNAKEYLRKFVDIIYSFPEPNLENYINFLFEQFKCGEKDTDLLNVSKEIIKKFNPSLRGIDNLFLRLNLIEKNINQPYVQAVFLLSLKEFDEEKYNKLIKGNLEINKIFDFKKYFETPFKYSDLITFWKLVNEIILKNSNSGEEYSKNLKKLMEIFNGDFLKILNSYKKNDGFMDDHFSLNDILYFFNNKSKIVTKKEMTTDESENILLNVFRSKEHYLKEFNELINKVDFLDGLDFGVEENIK